jgi:hypothetical protein
VIGGVRGYCEPEPEQLSKWLGYLTDIKKPALACAGGFV